MVHFAAYFIRGAVLNCIFRKVLLETSILCDMVVLQGRGTNQGFHQCEKRAKNQTVPRFHFPLLGGVYFVSVKTLKICRLLKQPPPSLSHAKATLHPRFSALLMEHLGSNRGMINMYSAFVNSCKTSRGGKNEQLCLSSQVSITDAQKASLPFHRLVPLTMWLSEGMIG